MPAPASLASLLASERPKSVRLTLALDPVDAAAVELLAAAAGITFAAMVRTLMRAGLKATRAESEIA